MLPLTFLFQRNLAMALARRALRTQMTLERKQVGRGGYERAKHVLASFDASVTPAGHFARARVLPMDVGKTYPDGSEIEEADVGKFWFVLGYSRIGGPDIIRPDED
jgi:hypothetical protein